MWYALKAICETLTEWREVKTIWCFTELSIVTIDSCVGWSTFLFANRLFLRRLVKLRIISIVTKLEHVLSNEVYAPPCIWVSSRLTLGTHSFAFVRLGRRILHWLDKPRSLDLVFWQFLKKRGQCYELNCTLLMEKLEIELWGKLGSPMILSTTIAPSILEKQVKCWHTY